MLALQLAFTYLPFMNAAFHSAPIGLASWLRVLGAGLIVYAAVGMEKWLLARGRALVEVCGNVLSLFSSSGAGRRIARRRLRRR